MALRITVDENGFVLDCEIVPDTTGALPRRPKQGTGPRPTRNTQQVTQQQRSRVPLRDADHVDDTTQPYLVRCPLCRVRLSNAALPYHLRNDHGVRSQRATGESSSVRWEELPRQPQPATSRILVPCPVCGVAVRETRIPGHIRKVHPMPADQSSNNSQNQRTSITEPVRPRKPSSSTGNTSPSNT